VAVRVGLNRSRLLFRLSRNLLTKTFFSPQFGVCVPAWPHSVLYNTITVTL
jgi:hypothetical protein